MQNPRGDSWDLIFFHWALPECISRAMASVVRGPRGTVTQAASHSPFCFCDSPVYCCYNGDYNSLWILTPPENPLSVRIQKGLESSFSLQAQSPWLKSHVDSKALTHFPSECQIDTLNCLRNIYLHPSVFQTSNIMPQTQSSSSFFPSSH